MHISSDCDVGEGGIDGEEASHLVDADSVFPRRVLCIGGGANRLEDRGGGDSAGDMVGGGDEECEPSRAIVER